MCRLLKGKLIAKIRNAKADRCIDLFGVIHIDICEPFTPPAMGGYKYFITFIDDYSHYGFVELIREKSKSDAPTWHPVSGKNVTNLRTINLLTYIILNNYLEEKKHIIILQNNIIPHNWSDQHIQLHYIQHFSLFSKIYVHHLKINQNIIDGHQMLCWPLLMWDVLYYHRNLDTYTDKHMR